MDEIHESDSNDRSIVLIYAFHVILHIRSETVRQVDVKAYLSTDTQSI